MKHCYFNCVFDKLHRLRFVMLLVSLFTAAFAWGQDVTYNQAKGIAADFFKSHGVKSETVVPQKVARKAPGKPEANSPYYIFNSDDASAFVVVSGDSRTQQVFAYSTEGAFDADNVAPGAQYFLDMYEECIIAMQDMDYGAEKSSATLYPDGKGYRLKTALWDQLADEFWGSACPTIGGNHTYAGCVATAMGILIRHHEWAMGSGSKTYTQAGLDFAPAADFGATDYHISSIPTNNDGDKTWTEQSKNDVATLLYHCGVAANMNYGTSESGAVLDMATIGLWKYFGYTLGHSVAFDGNVEKWVEMIKEEINAGNPVLYEGNSPSGGHAFICEGYDSDNRLYFNYGWSGYGNGYYLVCPADYSDPSTYAGVNEFHYYQNAKIGVRPNIEQSQQYSDVIFKYNDGTRESDGIFVSGKIQREVEFSVNVPALYNVADQLIPSLFFGVSIHREDINAEQLLRGYVALEDFKPANWTTGAISFPCKLPYDYKPSEGDYIYCSYTTDEGATWNMLPAYTPEYATLKVMDIYNPTPINHFVMKNEENTGLEIWDLGANSSVLIDGVQHFNINANGKPFVLRAHNLWTTLSCNFNGDVAVFLCDEDGNKVQQIGCKDFNFRGGYSFYSFSCTIPEGTELAEGDRLCLFSRYQGESEWLPVECETPDKGYASIPSSLIPTEKAIRFVTPYATFCSRYDLDLSGVTDIYAYRAVLKDSETITLERVTKIKAGEGVLLRGMKKTDGFFCANAAIAEATENQEDNLFVGVMQENMLLKQDAPEVTKYVLGELDGVVGFYIANGVTMRYGQAYLSVPASPSHAPSRISMSFADADLTGVTSIESNVSNGNSAIYNLQGAKVDSPVNGVYIINGKKYIKR